MKTITDIFKEYEEFIDISILKLITNDSLGELASNTFAKKLIMDCGESPEAIRGVLLSLDNTIQIFKSIILLDSMENSALGKAFAFNTMIFCTLFMSPEVQTIIKREADGLRY